MSLWFVLAYVLFLLREDILLRIAQLPEALRLARLNWRREHRSGLERRQTVMYVPPGFERRSGIDRRRALAA
jgi:hypothetical protein